MKLIARAAAALALLAFATPALPCGDKGMEKTVQSEKKSSTVAKSGTAEKKTPPAKGEAKPASAAN